MIIVWPRSLDLHMLIPVTVNVQLFLWSAKKCKHRGSLGSDP